ncbi:hypothetical protein Glove_243g12 [Diversispora epigaea]|uniref:Uncharacterized protein n=1 Tax=Diversispora epigaea TaxID=1348612 RepID=A0A397IEQ7_9GLOM|nr:hypothetical protein Glove_243g12 [Diversispora epigaea]
MSRTHHNINKRFAITGKHNVLNRIIDAERPYDSISMIFEGETPIQWTCHVRIAFQDLIDGTAICFHCIKLMHINVNLGLKASQFDLMKDHYDYECSRSQSVYDSSRSRTKFGCARVVQRLWRNFREREPSDAQLAWNSLSNDNIPDNKKFLGLTRCKVKNTRTREQFNQWRTKWITMYKQNNSSIPLPPSLVEESWKRLTTRKRNPLTELKACGINLNIENFLQHEIIVYNKKKEHQHQSPTPLENLSYIRNYIEAF